MPERPVQVQEADCQFRPWDSDHTALVHVLWAAQRDGLTLEDFDRLAEKIMSSRWMAAVRLHAKETRRHGSRS